VSTDDASIRQPGTVENEWRTRVRGANLPGKGVGPNPRAAIYGPGVEVVIAPPKILVRPSLYFRVLLSVQTFEAEIDTVVVQRVERRDTGLRLTRRDRQWAVIWTRRIDQLVATLAYYGVNVGPEVIKLSTYDLA
jgi:hypothetical protein